MGALARRERTIRCLLADDESPARTQLRLKLAAYPDVQVIGEASSGPEALRMLDALDYDAVFLDVRMPGIDGIDLADRLKKRPRAPRVVFVTAYEEYAVPAFSARACDYLLKPFDDERLAETVSRLRAAAGDEGASAAAGAAPPGPPLNWLLTQRLGRTIPVPLAEVVYLEADGDVVYVHTVDDKLPVLTRISLSETVRRLPADRFFRSHRSFAVNLARIKEIVPSFHGTYVLRMKDQRRSEVPVSRSHVKQFRSLFKLPPPPA